MLKPLLLLLTLTACGLTSEGNLLRSAVATQGREAAATALDTAIWFKCRGASVGSITDRYGRTAAMAKNWQEECMGEDGTLLFGPED